MAKQSGSGGFGVKVRKTLDLVLDKTAAETGEKAKKGLQEYLSAEEQDGKIEKEIPGVEQRWEKTAGLNRKAMKTLVAIQKMSDTKKADFLRTFLPGLEAILPDQLDIFADTNGGEDSKTPSEAKNPADNGAGAPLN